MRRLTWIALLLVASLALVGAGCGGDDEASSAAPVDEWATDFCTAVSDWAEELRQISETLQDPSSLSADALRDAGEGAGNATEAFVEDLRDLGGPDTESGDEIESSLETLADTVETEKDDLSETVEGIESIGDLPGAITAIGASFSAMGEALQEALSAVEDSDVSGELETALEDADACDEIQG